MKMSFAVRRNLGDSVASVRLGFGIGIDSLGQGEERCAGTFSGGLVQVLV